MNAKNLEKNSPDKQKKLLEIKDARSLIAGRRAPPQVRELCVKAVDGGMSVAEVAAALSVSRETIYKWTREAKTSVDKLQGKAEPVQVMTIQSEPAVLDGLTAKLALDFRTWSLILERRAA